jgi:16S rRNA (adenine1518-N6/adenine1519-N6)-dimethyltransferase
MSGDAPRRHRARKRFGQHFLEPVWVDKVAAAIDPRPDDCFLEIGPGAGALTRPLAARAKAVVAFEIDRDLAGELTASAADNVQVLLGDFLAADNYRLPTIPTDRVRVAGNLPYNVAAPILFKLVDMYAGGVPLTDATVMLQREVADRLLAVPGTKEYGVLTVLIRHSAAVQRLLNLPPGAFRPPPKVQSTVVRLLFHAPDPPVRNINVFRDLVQAVFTRRRKTLANALLAFRSGPVLVRSRSGPSPTGTGPGPDQVLRLAEIDGRRRPETLTVEEFARLADAFASTPHGT